MLDCCWDVFLQVVAIPFFIFTVIGTLVYVILLTGAFWGLNLVFPCIMFCECKGEHEINYDMAVARSKQLDKMNKLYCFDIKSCYYKMHPHWLPSNNLTTTTQKTRLITVVVQE